ncbi:reverse transcriptase-like protein [Sphingomonas sp. TX0543]|uniref:reverse transcriptase-like protein n=1 Tax=unclassified Sphingomonas TaxID=196159 RepID=UPI0010F6AD84|nr:reverse transcriptase-like protein [Sphingomonas sp. 3P27F8]
MPRSVKVYFDGGCRPAPAGMETAVVVRGQTYIQRDLGPGTSMDAEWLALIRAVEITLDLGLSDPVFLGDSLAVVRQAGGAAKCRRAAAQHFVKLTEIGTALLPLHTRYVRRAQNLAGIALAGIAR